MTMNFTGKGDDGSTRLMSGKLVPKSNIRIQVLGELDELNAHIGLAITLCDSVVLNRVFEDIQNDLFILGAELSNPENPSKILTPERIESLELTIQQWDFKLPELKQFILPGGTMLAAQLHITRAVSRRFERSLQELSERGTVSKTSLSYANRLSSFWFVAARLANHLAKEKEKHPIF